MPENGRAQHCAQPEHASNTPKDRAKWLYAAARTIEQRAADAVCQEIAREIAILALDLIAEARSSR